jgi:hypothetical protein
MMRFSKFLQGDEFGLISSNSSMFGRYSVAEESPLKDSVKSPLKGGVRNSCTPSTYKYALTKTAWKWNYYVVVV